MIRTGPRTKRLLDIVAACLASLLLIVPLLVLALLVKLTSTGPVLFWSYRVGKDNVLFLMPKLRTMHVATEVVATHLLKDPERCLTPIGGFLRRTSLDELPQLWCILRGDMSFVGPRPALYNQDNLIALRTQRGVHTIRPGLTGWAQISGRDGIAIPEKVDFDTYYLQHQSLAFDIKVILLTFLRVMRRDGVSH